MPPLWWYVEQYDDTDSDVPSANETETELETRNARQGYVLQNPGIVHPYLRVWRPRQYPHLNLPHPHIDNIFDNDTTTCNDSSADNHTDMPEDDTHSDMPTLIDSSHASDSNYQNRLPRELREPLTAQALAEFLRHIELQGSALNVLNDDSTTYDNASELTLIEMTDDSEWEESGSLHEGSGGANTESCQTPTY